MDTIAPHSPTRVRTLPATIATLALGALPDRVGRRLGSRVEVDVDAVRTVLGPAASGSLLRYHRRVLQFRAAPSGRYVDTTRTLLDVRLQDPKGGKRVTLGEQIDALALVTGVADVAERLLARDLDVDAVREAAGRYQHRLTRDGNKTVLELLVPAVGEWPLALGGTPGPDEVARRMKVEVNHAPSRRAVSHRLMAVKVEALERFPDPSA